MYYNACVASVLNVVMKCMCTGILYGHIQTPGMMLIVSEDGALTCLQLLYSSPLLCLVGSGSGHFLVVLGVQLVWFL